MFWIYYGPEGTRGTGGIQRIKIIGGAGVYWVLGHWVPGRRSWVPRVLGFLRILGVPVILWLPGGGRRDNRRDGVPLLHHTT